MPRFTHKAPAAMSTVDKAARRFWAYNIGLRARVEMDIMQPSEGCGPGSIPGGRASVCGLIALKWLAVSAGVNGCR